MGEAVQCGWIVPKNTESDFMKQSDMACVSYHRIKMGHEQGMDMLNSYSLNVMPCPG